MDYPAQVSLILAIAVLASTCSGQNSQETEKGVILTVQHQRQPGLVHLRHLNVLLPYDQINGSVAVPGVRLPWTPQTHFLSVEVDFRSKEIFMYDVHLKTLWLGANYNAALQGLNVTEYHVGIGTGAVQLAYDWLSKTIYWTDSVLRHIVAAPGSYGKIKEDHFTYLVSTNLEHPEGITVDPIAGYMFFSDNGNTPKIERAGLDGSERVNLNISGLSNPESLEVDIFTKKLYFIDTTEGLIMETDYNGQGLRQVRRFTYSTLTDIASYRETLYVTNARTGTLYIVNKTDGLLAYPSPIQLRDESIYGVAIYKEEVQPLNSNATTNCTVLNCDHICVSTPTGAKCICSEGYGINSTNTSQCIEKEGKFKKAVVVADATTICLKDIRALSRDVDKYPLKCIYTVIPPPTTTTSTTTTSTTTTTTTTPPSTMRTSPTTKPTTTASPTSPTTMITHSDHSTKQSTVTPTSTTPTSAPPTSTTPPGVPGRRKREAVDPVMINRVKRQATSPPTPAPTTPSTPLTNEEIVTFDLDMEERLLFFVIKMVQNKTVEYTIYERPIDMSINVTVREKITTTSGVLSGLAYDWIGGTENLFWSESDSGNIYLINTNDRNTVPVITGLPSPSDLHILAHTRQLIFIARPGGNYSIHRVDMDGNNLTEIYLSTSEIRDITVDQDKQIVFWIEDGRVYSKDLSEDNEPTNITSTESTQTDLIILYKNYLIWTEPTSEGGTQIDAYILDRQRIGNSAIYPNTRIVELKILDIDHLQTQESQYPCALRNGDCDQICVARLLPNNSYARECECALGFKLQPDGTSCRASTVENDFCLVTDWSNDQIFQIDFNTDSISVVHLDEGVTYFGVFYNKLTRKVVWSEVPSPDVYMSNINGQMRQLLADNPGDGQVEKFALDETTGNLFYTLNNYPLTARIGVVSVRGANRIISLDTTFRPYYFFSGIDVHPKRGLMFFTAASYFDDSYIVRANMDGTDAVKLRINVQEAFSLPEGLAIDHVNDVLYWADYYQDKIYKCDLKQMVVASPVLGCELFLSNPSADIKDIATDGEYIYYTAWNSHFVTRVELANSDSSKRVGNNIELGRLETVSCYRESKPNDQQQNTRCQMRDGRGVCSEFCLPTSNDFTCACDTGVQLLPNGRACETDTLCPMTFTQVNSDIQIIMKESCLQYVNETCMYTCQPGTKPKDPAVTSLNCTDDGSWDRQSEELCEVIYCPATLPNGAWATSCNRTAGSTCLYTCNTGWRTTASTVTCGLDGQWGASTSDLCTDKLCIPGFSNGQIQEPCSYENNAQCSYSCNGGYRKTTTAPGTLTCTQSSGSGAGVWSPNPNTVCEVIKCPASFVRGNISSGCNKNVDDVCTFTCIANSYKPAGLTTLTCLNTGQWDFKGQTPCSEVCTSSQFKCDTSHKCLEQNQVCDRKTDCPDFSDERNCTCSPAQLQHGSLPSNCDFFYDSTCNYACNRGFRKTVPRLTCQRSNALWTPQNPCQEIFCPQNFSLGGFRQSCDRKVDTICTYYCATTLTRSQVVTRVKCLPSGAWNQTTNLCLSPPSVTGAQGGDEKKKGSNKAGIAVGAVIAILVVIGVVVGAFILAKRRGWFKKESPYSTASFNNGNNVAIENPGYMTADLRVANDMDEPYINTAMQETPKLEHPMKPIDHHDIDTGIANPLYFNQEPLAAESEITQPTGDDVVLTTDSWLREKEKGPDDLSNNNQ